MSFFDKISRGRVRKPFFMALYSGPGIGKTSFAESFPMPHFFDFEESTDGIDVSRTRPLSFPELMDDLEEIYDRENITEFKTLVFDTLDELERLIHKDVAEDEKKNSVHKVGWQKGFIFSVEKFSELISICRLIRDKHQINILFLSHAYNRNVLNIDSEATYVKNSMALHPKAADYIFGQVEMVLFAMKKYSMKTVDDKTFVKDTDKRVLCTSLSAHYDAKNRIGLPSTLPMPFNNGYEVLKEA